MRFLEGYYVYVITNASVVADIGGHLVYTIQDTRLISLRSSVGAEQSPQEQRYF